MAVRMLHLADLHLGARCLQWGDRGEERQKDLESTFESAVGRALDSAQQVHAVIVAGDLFDRHSPPPRLVSFAKGQLERLTRAGIPVVMVPGTHDSMEHRESALKGSMPDGVYLFIEPMVGLPKTLELAGEPVHFYGMAYLHGKSKPRFDAFRRGPQEGYHVAVLHGSLENSPAWDMAERYVPLSLDRLGETGMHYVALGHYHNFQQYETNGVVVVYPGTLEGIKFAEKGDRYLTWVELDGDHARVQHGPPDEPVNSKRLEERVVDLSEVGAADEDALIQHVQAWADDRLAVQVRLAGTAEFRVDVEALAERLRASFALLDIRDEEVRFVDAELVKRLAREQTVAGMFVRRLRGMIDAAESAEERTRLELALKLALAEFMEA